MLILPFLIFVSLVLAASGVAFFIWTVRSGTYERTDRLALMPLADEPWFTPPPPQQQAVNHTQGAVGDSPE